MITIFKCDLQNSRIKGIYFIANIEENKATLFTFNLKYLKLHTFARSYTEAKKLIYNESIIGQATSLSAIESELPELFI